jgi:hypothetical protein
MGKISRYAGNLLAFAINSLGTERTVFGDVTQSDTLDDNVNTDFLRGLGIVGINDFPTRQDFNALGFTLGQLIAYLHQAGVAEWNVDQEYFDGSLTIHNGQVYKSLTASNIGNDPTTDSSNWSILPVSSGFPSAVQAGGLDVQVTAGKFSTLANMVVTQVSESGGNHLFFEFAQAYPTEFQVGDFVTITGTTTPNWSGSFEIDRLTDGPTTLRVNSNVPNIGDPPEIGTFYVTDDLGFYPSIRSVQDFAGDSVTIDPSALTAGQSRIDTIVIQPTNPAGGSLAVLEGIATLNDPEPSDVSKNDTIVGFVKVYEGMVEVIGDDIMTGFNPYELKNYGEMSASGALTVDPNENNINKYTFGSEGRLVFRTPTGESRLRKSGNGIALEYADTGSTNIGSILGDSAFFWARPNANTNLSVGTKSILPGQKYIILASATLLADVVSSFRLRVLFIGTGLDITPSGGAGDNFFEQYKASAGDISAADRHNVTAFGTVQNNTAAPISASVRLVSDNANNEVLFWAVKYIRVR